MKTIIQNLNENHPAYSKLVDLCVKNGVDSLRVFGSVARGEANKNSDIDILIRFKNPVSLLTLVRLERELSELLGRKVDLVTENALSPYIREKVLKSARVIYVN